jgi:RNA-directed DNA polymerase
MDASVGTAGTGTPEHSGSLLRRVVERTNMRRAYRRVISNRGSAGVDGMSVAELGNYLKENWLHIKELLLSGQYRPHAVLGVEIPKPAGGMRQLGIPTAVDRLIQQAIHQVLSPIFDVDFSENSYGFRPGRSAHQAVLRVQDFASNGYRFVVDMDVEKFFDRVNHDILMSRIARKVEDKDLLRLIRRYLQAGILQNGELKDRKEGTPQGGPLSPLLSNIILDDLDRELESRGHKFCRYADDCNVYVKSRRAGMRVLVSLARFLSDKLKLTVNPKKSAVDRPWKRKFLGYSMTSEVKPRLKLAPESIKRFKDSLKERFRRMRGMSIVTTITELNLKLNGWINYFKLVETKRIFDELDGWLRRRLRAVVWRQWKKPNTRRKNLINLGLAPERAWKSSVNGRGAWWNSGAPHMNEAFPKRFFDSIGLVSLLDARLKRTI